MKKGLLLTVMGLSLAASNVQADNLFLTKERLSEIKKVAAAGSHINTASKALKGEALGLHDMCDMVHGFLASALEDEDFLMKVNRVVNAATNAKAGAAVAGKALAPEAAAQQLANAKNVKKSEERKAAEETADKAVKAAARELTNADKALLGNWGRVEVVKQKADKKKNLDEIKEVVNPRKDVVFAVLKQAAMEAGHDVTGKYVTSKDRVTRRALRAATEAAVDGLVVLMTTYATNKCCKKEDSVLSAAWAQLVESAARNALYEVGGELLIREVENA